MRLARQPSIRRIYIPGQVVLLLTAIGATMITYRSADWRPIPLLVLLMGLAVLGEWFTLSIGNQNLSASFIALVLAMTLLGPTQAVTIGVIAVSFDLLHRREPAEAWPTNLAAYASSLALGGLISRLAVGDVHAHTIKGVVDSSFFALDVLGVSMIAVVVNFLLIALHKRVFSGSRVIRQLRGQLVPMLPGQLAAAALAAILALAYTNLGYPVMLAAVIVIVIFQYLAIALLRSEDRAEQLEARSKHLAALQLGVLVTLVETLALRDRAAARHAAWVARYSRALAAEIGLDESEQDLVHTAALLHDVGKFALPDRILHADVLSDADWATIRRHPQDGATLVGRLDGYGPVADIILYHHENVDGSGYPAGLIGNEIPLLSRVLAVCNAYDTLTARDSYRSPMTHQDAVAELRRSAGRQLDQELVQAFVTMLEREGPTALLGGGEASFEDELSFERRVRELAAPAER
jgi:putative nucleotidyltransferase with HDIG domain